MSEAGTGSIKAQSNDTAAMDTVRSIPLSPCISTPSALASEFFDTKDVLFRTPSLLIPLLIPR